MSSKGGALRSAGIYRAIEWSRRLDNKVSSCHLGNNQECNGGWGLKGNVGTVCIDAEVPSTACVTNAKFGFVDLK